MFQGRYDLDRAPSDGPRRTLKTLRSNWPTIRDVADLAPLLDAHNDARGGPGGPAHSTFSASGCLVRFCGSWHPAELAEHSPRRLDRLAPRRRVGVPGTRRGVDCRGRRPVPDEFARCHH